MNTDAAFTRCARSVIFVDCFKVVVLANGYERAMGFLKELKKTCFENKSNLIVQIDPSELTIKQIAAIEKVITSKT